MISREALAWMTEQLAGDGDAGDKPEAPVRVHVGGAAQWRDLEAWPPHDGSQAWYLNGGGALSRDDHDRTGSSSFRYDPADPTPSVGGQLLSPEAGPRDNRAVEARPDVLVFTSEPLQAPLDVLGPVRAVLHLRASTGHAHVFVRLCDVDPARAFTERDRRHSPPLPRRPGGGSRHGSDELHRPPVRTRAPAPVAGQRRRASALRPQYRRRGTAGHRHAPGPDGHRGLPRPGQAVGAAAPGGGHDRRTGLSGEPLPGLDRLPSGDASSWRGHDRAHRRPRTHPGRAGHAPIPGPQERRGCPRRSNLVPCEPLRARWRRASRVLPA